MNASSLSLDTSVVMRLLIQQPAEQYRRAAVYLEERLEEGVPIHVNDLVLAETYFALQHHYGISKFESLKILASFASSAGFVFSPHVLNILKTPGLSSLKPGFVDRLIHGADHSAGHTLVSFEKAMAKLSTTTVL